MIKYNVLIIFFSLSFLACIAQKQGYVEYEYNHPRATPVQLKATLSFDETKSVFTYSKDALEKVDNKVERKEGGAISAIIVNSDPIGYVYFRDFQKQQLTYRTVPSKLIDAYVVTDVWIPIDWKILNERKRIGKFNCRKAKGTFRGRDYTVWFTEEIPVSAGPWKLFGLPGLILEAVDSEGMLKAVAKKIIFPAEKTVDIKPSYEGKPMTVREYAAFMDDAARIGMERMKAKMPRELAANFRIIENKDDPKNRKYRDEKTFEWEDK